MDKNRKIRRLIKSKPTVEGAGVHLRRAFGFGETSLFDPFLLLDDFRSGDPEHYLPGFPWHPHRGIETITYILEGSVEHGDSLGNQGVIGPGDVQWMTAGSGIVHQEMPRGDGRGRMGGFQLWANLPAAHKMMDPRYRDVQGAETPQVSTGNGATVRIICGEVAGTRGPVRDIVTDPEYLDVTISPQSEWVHPTKPGYTVLAYVIEGKARFAKEDPLPPDPAIGNHNDTPPSPFVTDTHLVLYGDGEQIDVTTAGAPVRFLLISGKPLREPVAWYGPIVMNTQRELQIAFEEYRNGTFVKHKPAV